MIFLDKQIGDFFNHMKVHGVVDPDICQQNVKKMADWLSLLDQLRRINTNAAAPLQLSVKRKKDHIEIILIIKNKS